MGILDWFSRGRSNVEIAPDRIWLNKAAKMAGIAEEVRQCLAGQRAPEAVLLVAHFDDCLGQLRALAEEAGFEPERVMVAKAEALADRSAAGLGLDETQQVLILVAQRHPLGSRDDALEEFARTLPCRCRLVFHLSLEDALLAMFAGEWV